MFTESQVDPPSGSISPLHKEQIRAYQYETWRRDHFKSAIEWDVKVIGEFLRVRCTENISGNENGNEDMNVRDDEADCGESDRSSTHSASDKDEESSSNSSTASDDIFINESRTDLKNLWVGAIKPYFEKWDKENSCEVLAKPTEEWKKDNQGRVLVKKTFKVKIHGKDVEIFSIFCALAAVLNIAPLNTPKHPCPPPEGELSTIQYQWLLATLLGKWVTTIAAKFPTVFCVMSRQIGKDTIYVCGTTKPKVSTKFWPLEDRRAMIKSRHELVDKAIGGHPLELCSLEFTHDENTARRKLSSPLGIPEATEVKEITELEELFQEIWRFSVIYKEGEQGRREEEQEEEKQQRELKRLELLEIENIRKENEEKMKKIRDETRKKEKAERGLLWKVRTAFNGGRQNTEESGTDPVEGGEKKKGKRKFMRREKRLPILEELPVLGGKKLPVPEGEEKLELSPLPDMRARKGESSGVRRRHEGQQRIGDCAEVWGLATLAGLGGSESTNDVPSTLVSVSIDARTIKRMELTHCIDHICLNTAASKPACEGCTYLFNVVRFKSGTEAVDNMYPDGKCYTYNGLSQCTEH